MPDRGACDVVLFGYRNDLARERVLEYLAALPPTPAGPTVIDRATPVPQRLFIGLPAPHAQTLRETLERLGAQIAVVPLDMPPAAAPAAVRPSRPWRAPVMLLAALLTAVALKWLARPDAAGRLVVPLATPPMAEAPLTRIDTPRETNASPGEEAEALRLNATAVELAQQGQYAAAVEQLRQALRRVPEHPVIRQNLQTVLLNSALHELEAGHPAGALDQLREAVGFGERSDLRQALGLAHLQAGDYAAARADLEQAIAAGTNDPGVWLALGEAYLRLNDRPHALETLQRARESGARSPQLDALLARLGREVDAEWDFSALESMHFRVTFAEGENRVAAQLVLDGLEDARNEVGAKLGVLPSEVTEVVLYAAQDFHTITQTPVWAGGAYDGRIKVPVRGLEAADPTLPRLLRHEYAHSVLADLSGNRCPVWLSEGVAVWAEEEQDGERRAWAEDALRGAHLFRLPEIAGPFTGLPPEQALVAYAESYLAVRELIDRYGARKLPQLVTELSRQPLAAAFATVYGAELADFEDRWLRSLTS